MMIPDLMKKIDNPLFIKRHAPLAKNHVVIVHMGLQKCSLEMIAVSLMRPEPVSICPWHWRMILRDDTYPFKRANAHCNCRDCQAKTIYDSDSNKLAACQSKLFDEIDL